MEHSSIADAPVRQRVTRLSPHQNGKVFAVLMAATSLIFLLPFALLFSAFAPARGTHGAPFAMVLVMPLMYLVFGYLSVAIGCWVYNLVTRWTGGLEFESTRDDATITPP